MLVRKHSHPHLALLGLGCRGAGQIPIVHDISLWGWAWRAYILGVYVYIISSRSSCSSGSCLHLHELKEEAKGLAWVRVSPF